MDGSGGGPTGSATTKRRPSAETSYIGYDTVFAKLECSNRRFAGPIENLEPVDTGTASNVAPSTWNNFLPSRRRTETLAGWAGVWLTHQRQVCGRATRVRRYAVLCDEAA